MSVCRLCPAQTPSASSSPTPGILATPSPTPDADAGLRAACNDTLNELLKARVLIKDQDDQLERYQSLTKLDDQISTGLKNLRTMDAEEKQHLRDALTAADKEIAAVRSENTSLRTENTVLKKNQMTIWKKGKWFLIGGAFGAVVAAVLGGR